jgi:hypothetical protein
MFFYIVNNKIFNNPFLAFLYGSQNSPHEFPKFYANESVFDHTNWSIEPAETWEELCLQRAQWLRQKYQYLVLSFSGGTDSVTIYNIFKKHNIHLDEIIILYGKDYAEHPTSCVQWLLSNHWDPSTKISHMDRRDNKVVSRHFDKTDWILQDIGAIRKYNLTSPGPEIEEHCQQSSQGKSWCLITGHEKPHLRFEKGQWWITHLDHVFHSVMGWPNVEMFFIGQDPRLHVKQCHMLKNHIKANKIKLYEGWSSYACLGKKSQLDYENFAIMCGRDLDIVRGISFIQKNNNNGYLKTDSEFLFNGNYQALSHDLFLKEKIIENLNSAVKYRQGWLSLQQDFTLNQYMTRHGLLHSKSQPLQNYNAICSKLYCLGA